MAVNHGIDFVGDQIVPLIALETNITGGGNTP